MPDREPAGNEEIADSRYDVPWLTPEENLVRRRLIAQSFAFSGQAENQKDVGNDPSARERAVLTETLEATRGFIDGHEVYPTDVYSRPGQGAFKRFW